MIQIQGLIREKKIKIKMKSISWKNNWKQFARDSEGEPCWVVRVWGVLGGAEFPHDLRRGEHELGDPPQGTTHPPWPSTLLRGGRDARSGMQLGGQLPSGPARLHPQRERGEGGKKQFYENVRLLEPGETFANFRIPDCSRRRKKRKTTQAPG